MEKVDKSDNLTSLNYNKWDAYFLRHAYLSATLSKDPRTQIGACLVIGGRKGTVISEGYNGFPRKVVDSVQRYEDRLVKLEYVVHAEHNCVLNCARNGIKSYGSICYTNGTPCNNCAKSLINGGIVEVVIHKEWEDMFNERPSWLESHKVAMNMFNESGIPVRQYSGFLGVKLMCDGKLVEV